MKPTGNDQVGPGDSFEKTRGALFGGTGKCLNRLGASRDAGEHGLNIAESCNIGAVGCEEKHTVAFPDEPLHHLRQLAEVCRVPPCILLRPKARVTVRDWANPNYESTAP